MGSLESLLLTFMAAFGLIAIIIAWLVTYIAEGSGRSGECDTTGSVSNSQYNRKANPERISGIIDYDSEYNYYSQIPKHILVKEARHIGLSISADSGRDYIIDRIITSKSPERHWRFVGESESAKSVSEDNTKLDEDDSFANDKEEETYWDKYDILKKLPKNKVLEIAEIYNISELRKRSKRRIIRQILKAEKSSINKVSFYDQDLYRLSGRSIFLLHVDDSGLKCLIDNINAHLLALRRKFGHVEYCQSVAVQITGETIVAFQMAFKLRSQNQMNQTDRCALPLQQAISKTKALRRDLYKEYECTFDPYFECESRVVDLGLASLRRSSSEAAEGDDAALFELEYLFSYHHALLGMYYGWHALALSGKSASEAASAVTGSTDIVVDPSTLSTLLRRFAPILGELHSDSSGRFKSLYTRPSH